MLTDFNFLQSHSALVTIQKDGKIVLAGNVITPDKIQSFFLARYQTDGKIDSTFSVDGFVISRFEETYMFSYPSSLKIQDDGQILLAGGVWDLQGIPRIVIVRYNINGTPDESFGSSGKMIITFGSNYLDPAYLAIQKDHKIVVGGRTDLNGTGDFALARLNKDGTLDNSFGTAGIQFTDIAGRNESLHSIAIQNDGKIVAVGSINIEPNNTDFAMIRFNSDGSPDTTFDEDGKVIIDFAISSDARSVNIQPDGKLVVAGSLLNFGFGGKNFNDIAVARCNSDGTLDETLASVERSPPISAEAILHRTR